MVTLHHDSMEGLQLDLGSRGEVLLELPQWIHVRRIRHAPDSSGSGDATAVSVASCASPVLSGYWPGQPSALSRHGLPPLCEVKEQMNLGWQGWLSCWSAWFRSSQPLVMVSEATQPELLLPLTISLSCPATRAS